VFSFELEEAIVAEIEQMRKCCRPDDWVGASTAANSYFWYCYCGCSLFRLFLRFCELFGVWVVVRLYGFSPLFTDAKGKGEIQESSFCEWLF